MKLLSLNLWAGKIHDELIAFLKKHKDEIDIFCFQEPYSSLDKNVYEDCVKILHNHVGYFPPINNKDSPTIFVRNSLEVIGSRRVPVFKDDSISYQVDLGCVTLQQDGNVYTISNIHGFWKAKDKNDNPSRLQQSENIKSALQELPGIKVLCGDFNISPSTESIAILERIPLRNLIKENHIESTRTHHFTGQEKIADYVLVSPETVVKSFRLFDDVVSDHLPLYLEFH